MVKRDLYVDLIENALGAFRQNDMGRCRSFLEDYFNEAKEGWETSFPQDLAEAASLWYAVMIDTGLCSTCEDSPSRKFFVKVAGYKFQEAPPDMREKFMEGLDRFFPPLREEE